MESLIANFARMMEAAVPGKDFRIKLWDGTEVTVGKAPLFTLWFKSKSALARTVKDQFLGFGEAYMAGEIEIEGDMQLLWRMGHLMGFADQPLSLMEKLKFAVFALSHRNTLDQSRKNISEHYDLGNDLYQIFLDETMAYTCAYFHSPDQTLEQAQLNKYDHVCRKLMLTPGQTMADLGCGWGGLLIHAAQNYGITGIGVTLSKEQHKFAQERTKALGLEDRIQFHVRDYREVTGTFDAVSSIGMLEHVGKGFIPEKVKKIKEIVKPGGLAVLHFIGNDIPYPDDPWTAKYIFPGYHAPVLDHVIRELAGVGQSILDVENLRMHYVHTLRHWLGRFEANREKIEAMYDKTFYRCWQIYLSVGISSFEYGGNRLFQILFSNGLNNDLPLTRERLYPVDQTEK